MRLQRKVEDGVPRNHDEIEVGVRSPASAHRRSIDGQSAMHLVTNAKLVSRQSMERILANPWLSLLIVAWSVAVGVTWWLALAYEFKGAPTTLGAFPAYWPKDTGLVADEKRPTVVFFVHPKCPCTHASLAELERLWVLREENVAQRSPHLIVVITVPAGASDDWTATTTVERAKKLSGATLVYDLEGREAHRFGATTSGTVMWFEANGRSLYAGGITGSRGHEGDNAGRDSLEALMRTGIQPVSVVPALGCKLCLPAGEIRKGDLAEK
jgi:hypothetical protein